MQEAKKIMVSLVTSNSLAYLPNFFASLDAQTEREFTVTVVDNASDDGTVKRLQEAWPEVTVLRNFRDQGYARAANQAMELALSRWPAEDLEKRYVLFADLGLGLSSDCLRALSEELDRDQSLSAVCPKILLSKVKSVGDDGSRETENTTTLFSTGLFLTKTRRAMERGNGEEDKGQYDAPSDVFGVSSLCGLYRASALASAKQNGEYFDADFGYESVHADLAWRMRRLGLRARYIPEARAYLHGGKQPSSKYLRTRNRTWTLWKNEEIGNYLIHAPWTLAAAIASVIGAVFSYDIFRGLFAAWGGFFKMLKKRRALAGKVKVSGSAVRRWLV